MHSISTQARYRGGATRAEQRGREEAATRLQAVHRGNAARSMADAKRAERALWEAEARAQEEERAVEAATTIQKRVHLGWLIQGDTPKQYRGFPNKFPTIMCYKIPMYNTDIQGPLLYVPSQACEGCCCARTWTRRRGGS